MTAQNDPESFIIKTKVGNFLPDEDANLSNLGNGFSAASTFQDRAYQLIQFYDLPSEGDLAKFNAAGIQFLNYVPNNAYIASFPTTTDISQLKKLNIRAILDIPAIYKLNGRLLEDLPDYASNGKQVDVVLHYYEDIALEAILGELRNGDLDILAADRDNQFLIVRISVDDITKFSTFSYVEWIDLVPEPGEPEDLGGQNIHRSNAINNQLAGGYRFDGEGVKVLVRDDGIVGPHIDYKGRLNNLTFNDTGTHGDGVGGVMSGGGNLDPTITGMAPGSEVYVIDYEPLFTVDNTLALHQNDGVNITNSSYSDGCNAGYTTTTEAVDDQTFQNPTLLHVFSAGNSNGGCATYGAGDQWGNVTGGHKIGKNVIATANLFADGSLVSSSSRGPAADGRLKPDISAHGQGQLATNPNNGYQTFGGTSAAAPGIAGVSAQLYQAYKAMHNGTDPEAALIKATLLNTADEMGNLGPDFKFGFGRVNGLKALKLLEEGRYLSGTISNAQSMNHTISVPANVKQVKVMVYWAEPAPANIAGPALINDLDIKLTTPSNTEFLPWVLDETPNPAALDAPATRGVDQLNNIEQVTLDDPAAGNYTLNVAGSSVPMGPQKY
ncbi:MAG: S8 family serine peptidase, partial [Bacteroidota bacterium]